MASLFSQGAGRQHLAVAWRVHQRKAIDASLATEVKEVLPGVTQMAREFRNTHNLEMGLVNATSCRWNVRLGALLAGVTRQMDELTDQLFSLRVSAVWEILDAPTRAAANMITPPSNSTAADTLAPLTFQLDQLGGLAATLAFALLLEGNFIFLMTDPVFERHVGEMERLLCGNVGGAPEFSKQPWVVLCDAVISLDMFTPRALHIQLPKRRREEIQGRLACDDRWVSQKKMVLPATVSNLNADNPLWLEQGSVLLGIDSSAAETDAPQLIGVREAGAGEAGRRCLSVDEGPDARVGRKMAATLIDFGA